MVVSRRGASARAPRTKFESPSSARIVVGDCVAEMSKLAKKKMPLTMMLIGGKDKYPEIYKKVYGMPPKLIPPK